MQSFVQDTSVMRITEAVSVSMDFEVFKPPLFVLPPKLFCCP